MALAHRLEVLHAPREQLVLLVGLGEGVFGLGVLRSKLGELALKGGVGLGLVDFWLI